MGLVWGTGISRNTRKSWWALPGVSLDSPVCIRFLTGDSRKCNIMGHTRFPIVEVSKYFIVCVSEFHFLIFADSFLLQVDWLHAGTSTCDSHLAQLSASPEQEQEEDSGGDRHQDCSPGPTTCHYRDMSRTRPTHCYGGNLRRSCHWHSESLGSDSQERGWKCDKEESGQNHKLRGSSC